MSRNLFLLSLSHFDLGEVLILHQESMTDVVYLVDAGDNLWLGSKVKGINQKDTKADPSSPAQRVNSGTLAERWIGAGREVKD